MTLTKIVRIIRVTFFEDDVYEGSIPHECYENARVDDVPCDDVDEAVSLIQREGLDFASTGTVWAGQPDGSAIVDHYAGEREEVSAHLYGWSDADADAIMERVG